MKNLRATFGLAGLPKPKPPVAAPVMPPVVAAAVDHKPAVEPPAAPAKRTTPLPNLPQVRSPSRGRAPTPPMREIPLEDRHVMPDHVVRFPVGADSLPVPATPRERRPYNNPPAQAPAVPAAAVVQEPPRESFFAEREPPAAPKAPVVAAGAKPRLPFNKPRPVKAGEGRGGRRQDCVRPRILGVQQLGDA